MVMSPGGGDYEALEHVLQLPCAIPGKSGSVHQTLTGIARVASLLWSSIVLGGVSMPGAVEGYVATESALVLQSK